MGCGIFLILATALCAEVPGTSPLLQWTGRTTRDEGRGRVSFDWLGTQVRFNVVGATSVWATLNSTFWAAPPAHAPARSLQQGTFPKFGVYRVYVDGARVSPPGHGGVVVFPGESEHLLVAGLDPAAAHTVTLFYSTDAVDNSWPNLDLGRGCAQTVAAVRTDGAFSPPPPPRARRMVILGDSITSGAAMYPPCENATTCDASQSYATLLCEAFALNCTLLTASSKGLLHNCCDGLPVTVPALANRTFAQDNSSAWDWAAAPADAIFVNLGTNDGAQAPPANFTDAYAGLLLRLAARAAARNVPIFAAWGTLSDLYAPWVAAAAARVNAMGLNVTLVGMMGCPRDGCGHPGVLGHPCMAKIAAPIIQNATGWALNESALEGSNGPSAERSERVAEGPAPRAAAQLPMDVVRSRLLEAYCYVPQASLNSSAALALSYARALLPNKTWPDINYHDPQDRALWLTQVHLSRTLSMVAAWATPGSPVRGVGALGAAARNALAWWLEADPQCDNWWFNLISVPQMVANIFLLFSAGNATAWPSPWDVERGMMIMFRRCGFFVCRAPSARARAHACAHI